MATRNLQPSEYEIQREVEALRDIRRRSTTPGALTIDPDLPNQSPPSSPTAYRTGSPAATSPLHTDSSGSSRDDHSSLDSSNGAGGSGSSGSSSSNNPADDPFHLFWVPASLHPEIAPAEFRAFLKEHARSPPLSDGSTMARSDSLSSLSSSSSLGRKKSMLSRQYRPAEHDGVEDEQVVPLRRNRSSLYSSHTPQLTINDLQKLEEWAEEASESDDPSRLRNALRRSLSLNRTPSATGHMDDMSEMGDEADAPIIVPPPGQILRRAARTKIRKPGLPGDGGGHRFGSTRRGTPTRTATAPVEHRTSSDVSSSDHGDSVESASVTHRHRTFSDEGFNQRPDSFSEEASIYDAYARDDDDEIPAPVVVTSPPVAAESPIPPPPPSEIQPGLLEALGPVLHQPQPQSFLSPQPPSDYQEPTSRTPSPQPSLSQSTEIPIFAQPPPSFLSTSPSPPAHQRKDKDKKGLFGKWGGDKAARKNGKHKDRESQERAAEREKESGFFGSLFGGGSKKKQDQDFPQSLGVHGGTSGREAAQALLGASKSKAYVPPTSPGLAAGVGPNSYARYPIHVERAIYRLSHIKLANPRRPLYEQVLISNLMFWYLGVINKTQNPASPPNGQATTGAPVPAVIAGGLASENDQNDQAESERAEREQSERAERERLERERLEKEQREREIDMKKKESGRKGSLTKPPVPGSPSGGRKAEMPVKGPQYEMQHRVMEQEYSGYSGQPQQSISMSRSPSSPVGGGNIQQYPRTQQQPQARQLYDASQKLPRQPTDNFYYSSDSEQNQQQQSRLPPGAMPPVEQSSWLQQSQVSPRKQSPPSPQNSNRSRSPPPQNQIAQPLTTGRHDPNASRASPEGISVGRIPGRSLSATVVASPPLQVNGKIRKGASAHAVPSHGRRPRTSEGRQEQNGAGEEEDMPLAVWQQQRRR